MDDKVFWLPAKPQKFEGEDKLAYLFNLYNVTAVERANILDGIAGVFEKIYTLSRIRREHMHEILFLCRRYYVYWRRKNDPYFPDNTPKPPIFKTVT